MDKEKSSDKKAAAHKSESTVFFTELKKYLKKEKDLTKTYKGVFHIDVDMGASSECWEINMTKETGTVKKTKNLDPKTVLEIEDANLLALYEKKLLYDELKIQQRIKLKGTASDKGKWTKLIQAFLAR